MTKINGFFRIGNRPELHIMEIGSYERDIIDFYDYVNYFVAYRLDDGEFSAVIEVPLYASQQKQLMEAVEKFHQFKHLDANRKKTLDFCNSLRAGGEVIKIFEIATYDINSSFHEEEPDREFLVPEHTLYRIDDGKYTQVVDVLVSSVSLQEAVKAYKELRTKANAPSVSLAVYALLHTFVRVGDVEALTLDIFRTMNEEGWRASYEGKELTEDNDIDILLRVASGLTNEEFAGLFPVKNKHGEDLAYRERMLLWESLEPRRNYRFSGIVQTLLPSG